MSLTASLPCWTGWKFQTNIPIVSLTSSEVTCTARATTDTTHASIEQIGTMSTNIALDYYNHYPEATMPWIERAEKALDLLAK
jgi:hypothetical protein